MKKVISVFLFLFPWPLRRWFLVALFGYKIHPTARIGFSIVCPVHLEMGENSLIGSLTVCKGLSLLKLGDNAVIGNLNWITGVLPGDKNSYADDAGRRPELIVETHAAITTRHWIDCTDAVHVGRFAILAGCGSQVLTHSIDLEKCRQSSRPVRIGEYCFVGSGSILLAGSALPDYSVLAAGSVLNKPHAEPYFLYGGVPARAVKPLSADLRYFQRETGHVS